MNAPTNQIGSKWKIKFARQARRDAEENARGELHERQKALIAILEDNPFEPPYEKLQGDLKDSYSRRLNIQNRIVYQVDKNERTVKIIRMRSHYE